MKYLIIPLGSGCLFSCGCLTFALGLTDGAGVIWTRTGVRCYRTGNQSRIESDPMKMIMPTPLPRINDPADLIDDMLPLTRRPPGPGHPFKIMDSVHLKSEVQLYFDWNRLNPLYDTKPFSTKEGIELVKTPITRVTSIEALTNFIGICDSTWYNWKRKGHKDERKELQGVIRWAEHYMRHQKLEGAAGGQLNANIIARLLGLTEKTEVKQVDVGALESEYDFDLLDTDELETLQSLLDKATRPEETS